MRKFILDEAGNPKEVEDVLEWARQHEERSKACQEGGPDPYRVAQNDLSEGESVSTVFLGLDHNWSGKGDPVLWETMVFGGPHDGHMRRYRTREEAEKGHAEVVEALVAGKDPGETS